MTHPMTDRLLIASSHLALRFYKCVGWTKELLDIYLDRGEVRDQIPCQEVRDYWFLNHEKGSRLDMDRLVAQLNPRVFNWKDQELHGEDALKYLKEMNW